MFSKFLTLVEAALIASILIINCQNTKQTEGYVENKKNDAPQSINTKISRSCVKLNVPLSQMRQTDLLAIIVDGKRVKTVSPKRKNKTTYKDSCLIESHPGETHTIKILIIRQDGNYYSGSAIINTADTTNTSSLLLDKFPGEQVKIKLNY